MTSVYNVPFPDVLLHTKAIGVKKLQTVNNYNILLRFLSSMSMHLYTVYNILILLAYYANLW